MCGNGILVNSNIFMMTCLPKFNAAGCGFDDDDEYQVASGEPYGKVVIDTSPTVASTAFDDTIYGVDAETIDTNVATISVVLSALVMPVGNRASSLLIIVRNFNYHDHSSEYVVLLPVRRCEVNMTLRI